MRLILLALLPAALAACGNQSGYDSPDGTMPAPGPTMEEAAKAASAQSGTTNITDLEPEEFESIKSTPRGLGHALDALEEDHAFLLEGGVFSQDVIYYWIKYKRENEIAALHLRPHPYEFCMYFDI